MEWKDYDMLAQRAIAGDFFGEPPATAILTDSDIELLPLLNAAYRVRKCFHGKKVAIHIINNAANGYCVEDCGYCAQSKHSTAKIDAYGLKSDEEILAEARSAYENGAFRHCLVFSGRGPSPGRVKKMCLLIQQIKTETPGMEICVSAGLMDTSATRKLKQAGLDRLNHNLNTSEKNYVNICSTHSYQDRLDTLKAAGKCGLEVCSGMIAGMGESPPEIVEVALRLRDLQAKSIPINFLMPIEGNPTNEVEGLSPEYCLRILCLFRFLNPQAEIRAAAGREFHLRSLQVMAFYPANSLFLQGYLNTQGDSNRETLQMIRDAGFTIKSDMSLVSESYRKIKTSLLFSAPADELKSILVAGSAADCGATTVATNLALTFVNESKKVLLVDSNFHRPQLDSIFPNGTAAAGLSDVLTGQATDTQVIRTSGEVQGLDVVPSGQRPPNPAVLLNSQQMKEFLEGQRKNYDYIILDGPPTLLVSDSRIIGGLVDGAILVVHANDTSRGTASRMIREFKTAKNRILGIVLNAVQARKGGYFREAFESYNEYVGTEHGSIREAEMAGRTG